MSTQLPSFNVLYQPPKSTPAAPGPAPASSSVPGLPSIGVLYQARGRRNISALITTYAAMYDIPEALAVRLVRRESGGDPTTVSKKGAQGVMQLMPATARALGVTDPFDPEQNIEAGMRYLRGMYERFGRWDLALAAYNAGPSAVREHGGIPPFKETRDYVDALLRDLPELKPKPTVVAEPAPGVAPGKKSRAQIEQEARIQELRRKQEVYIPGVGWVLRENAEQLLGGPEKVTTLPVRTAQPQPAFARGFTRGFLAPLPVEIVEPEGKPALPSRVAEVGGEVAGFVVSPAARILGFIGRPLTSRLGAAAARKLGPQVAHHLGRIVGVGAEGGVYGIADYLVRDWDTFKILADEDPKTAAQVLGLAAGLTAAQFAAFGVAFEGLVGLIRRGVLTKRTWDAIGQTIRGISETRPDVPEFAPAPESARWTVDARRAAARAMQDILRRQRVGRAELAPGRGVELQVPEGERIGELELTPRAGVTPVTEAPVREKLPTKGALREAEVQREEELQRQLSASKLLVRPGQKPSRVILPGEAPEPSAAPKKVLVPAKGAKPREVLRGRPQVTDAEIKELEGYGWKREQIANMTPQQGERALSEGRLRVMREEPEPSVPEPTPSAAPAVPTAQPAPAARAAPAAVAPSLKVGDVVTYRKDGELYRVETVGPRGYNLVDTATGRKRISVMREQAAKQLQPVLVPTQPRAEERPAPPLELAGQETAVPAGEQATLLPPGTPTGPRAEFGKPAPGKFVESGFAAGDTVRITDGPDRGKQGVVLRVGRHPTRADVVQLEIKTSEGEEITSFSNMVEKVSAPRAEGTRASQELQQQLERERAAEKAAQRAQRKPAGKPPTEMTIGEYVRSEGIALEKNADIVGELKALQREGRVPPGMFKKTGRALDDLAVEMNGLGFRDPDGRELTADSIVEALKAQYGKRLPRGRFLHPAAEAHVARAEEEIAAAQERHYAEEEGLATAVVEKYLNFKPKERKLIDQALRQAFDLVGELKKAKDVGNLVAQAARIYNTELLPKVLRVPADKVPADRKLTPKFFREILPTRLDPGTLPPLPKRKKGGLPYTVQEGGGGSILGGAPTMAEIFLSPTALRRLKAFRRRLLEGGPAYTAEEVAGQARRVLKEGRVREMSRQTPLEFDGHGAAAMAEDGRIPPPLPGRTGPRPEGIAPPAVRDIGISAEVLTPRHVFHKMGPAGETVYNSMIFAWDTFSTRYERFLVRLGDIQRQLGMRHWRPIHNRRVSRRLFNAIDDPEGFAQAIKLGQARGLTEVEQKAVNELKAMLDWYADRIDAARVELGLEPINRRKHYVTHLVNDTVRFMLESQRGIPEDLAKAMRFSLPGEIFHPFLLERKANLPVIEDVFAALRAYVRVTEKMLAFNPVLPVVRQNIEALPPNGQQYADWWVRNVLGQPGYLSNLIDNTAQRLSGILGYKRVRLPGEVAKALQLPVQRRSSLQAELEDDLEAVDVLVPRLYNLFRRGVGRRGVTWVKRLNYYSFIGLNIKVGLVNMTQPITTLARLRGWPHQVLTDMAAGYGRVLLDIFRPSRWRYWKDRGVLSEMEKLMDEELAAGQGLLGDVLMLNMKITEFVNRVATATAKARELGRVERIYGDEALRLGREFSDFVNFRYGTPFTPKAFAAGGTLGPFGNLFYSYQTFAANQMYVMAQMSEKLRIRHLLPDAFKAMGRGPSAFGEYVQDLAAGERGELLRYLFYGGVTAQLLAPLGIKFWDTFVKGIAPSYVEAGAEFLAGFFTGDTGRMQNGWRMMIPPALSRGIRGLEPLRTQRLRINRAVEAYERGILTSWEAFIEAISGSRARELTKELQPRRREREERAPRR